MENDSGLLGLTKVQPATDNQIEQIIGRVASIKRRLDVIARDQKFFLSVRRSEGCALRIVGSTGQKLQGEKWMRGAAFAQIDFDRVRLPGLRFCLRG